MSDNPFLDELIHDKASGALRYKDVRYLLIRPETIVGFQKSIAQACGPSAAEKLFEGGFTGGSLSSKKYRELHHYNDYEIIEYMLTMGNQIGWGSFSLEDYDPQNRCLRVSVANSPFAESYGSSATGVCHLIRGVLAGMAFGIFNTECAATETECLAMGDRRCLFVIGEGN